MAKRRVRHRRDWRDFKLPLHAQLRSPAGLSPLAQFIESCGEEVAPEEAVREYQQDWCEHPKQARMLISTLIEPTTERTEFHIACTECGLVELRRSRPNLG